MKWFFAVLVIAVGFGIGWFLSQRKKRRVNLLKDLGGLCESITSNLSFSCDPIDKILLAQKKDSTDLKLLNAAYLDNRGDAEKQKAAINELTKKCTLTEEEDKIVTEFFSTLGCSDAKTQTATLAHYKELFGNFYREAYESWKKTGALYWKLGLLIGIGAGILIAF